jgi:cysteine desulfurase
VDPIYLDYNATTPVAPEVLEAMLPWLRGGFGNPSSGHRLGREAAEAVQKARGQVAAAIGALPEEIVFTSGGSECNNMAIKGVFLSREGLLSGRLGISSFEHPATEEPARYLEGLGVGVDRFPCGPDGVVLPSAAAAGLSGETRLVSVMHSNNELGTLQPIAGISKLCREIGALCHTDASQSIGKVPVDVGALGVDLLTIAGHKVYAPKGVGALYVRRGVRLEPLVHGAGHEGGRRAGTENVPYWVGLGAAMEQISKEGGEAMARMGALRDRLHRLLAESVPGLGVNGGTAPRLPNTLSLNFPGVVGGDLLAAAPRVLASTGAACHSGETRLSSTLRAIGLDPGTARGTIRLSIGRCTTGDEIEAAAAALAAAWRRLLA